MSEEIGESQEIVTPATQEAPQGEAPNTPDPAPDENTQADAAEQPEEHKVPKGVQKRIDRLTRERYRLQGELEAMRRQHPKQETQQPTSAAGSPKPEQFQSYEDYLEAKAEWKAEQKVAEVLNRQQESTKRQTAQAEHDKLQQSWEKSVDEAIGVYDDFEEVALAPDVPISDAMSKAILRSGKSADVAYYLGKNREEAAKIASMDPLSAAIAIGRIEATLARPAAKKTTSAPPPISTVGARASVSKDPDKMSVNEWLKWRNEQIKAR
jgi:hypothetical protein